MRCAARQAMRVTRQQSGPVRARFEELEKVAELPMHVAERLARRLHLHDRRRLRPRRAAAALRGSKACGDVCRSGCTSSKSFFARKQSSAIESPSISVNAPELTWYLRPVPLQMWQQRAPVPVQMWQGVQSHMLGA